MRDERTTEDQVVLTRGHDGRYYSPDGDPVELNRPEKRPEGKAVRHKVSGDLGHLFLSHDQEFVRYDRPGQELVRPYNQNEWVELEYRRTLAPIAIAMACFAFDTELARALAEPAKKEWGFLSQADKMGWVAGVESGAAPRGLHGPRADLFEAIVREAKPLLE